MNKRGFQAVVEQHKQYGKTVSAHGVSQTIYPPVISPKRADKRSAGYDFYSPIDFVILPGQTFMLWTNVKAYMQGDEVLKLYVRSSIGVKHNVTLANGTGIVDASYYENINNDGNIGVCLRNNSGQAKEYKAGERIAQGIFVKYLIADEDETIHDERVGGIGSSGN